MGVEQRSEQGDVRARQLEAMLEHFKRVTPDIGLVFEMQLQQLGLLPGLEEVGVLPVVDEATIECSADGPTEAASPWEVEERREEVLKLLLT